MRINVLCFFVLFCFRVCGGISGTLEAGGILGSDTFGTMASGENSSYVFCVFFIFVRCLFYVCVVFVFIFTTDKRNVISPLNSRSGSVSENVVGSPPKKTKMEKELDKLPSQMKLNFVNTENEDETMSQRNSRVLNLAVKDINVLKPPTSAEETKENEEYARTMTLATCKLLWCEKDLEKKIPAYLEFLGCTIGTFKQHMKDVYGLANNKVEGYFIIQKNRGNSAAYK